MEEKPVLPVSVHSELYQTETVITETEKSICGRRPSGLWMLTVSAFITLRVVSLLLAM